jgi:type II secretory pathway predicted ATPase ExeA
VNHKLTALFGLKWTPFTPDLPIEALWRHQHLDHFCWRIETLVQEGGFALISGDPGTGKSVALRTLAHHLARLPDVRTGVLTRPQSRLADFYRELGQLFGVPLSPHNRWAGFKALRHTWLTHVDATHQRPCLLIDESQELAANVLAELRILASADFDSRSILTVVLCGDSRLTQLFRREDFLPVASRIRVRLALDYLPPETLADWLVHSITQAGNPSLLTHEVITTLSEHAAGNLRVLATMANELLAMAAKNEASVIDQKLYLEVFAPPTNDRRKSARAS